VLLLLRFPRTPDSRARGAREKTHQPSNDIIRRVLLLLLQLVRAGAAAGAFFVDMDRNR
jgi:hypothetical protein